MKRYGQALVLDHVSLRVAEREVVALIGPSGSSKSTLVRCIHQLVPIEGGAVYMRLVSCGDLSAPTAALRALGHRAIAAQRQRIGMVFQQFNLFPHMSVLRNVMEGRCRCWARTAEQARAYAGLLDRVGLLAGRTPTAPAVGRPAAARGDARAWPCGPRPCVRRAHQRAGP